MASITERQTNLIRAMQAQNFEQFFDGDAKDAYETLTSAMESLVNYQNSVIAMETQIKFLRFVKEGQDFRDAVQQLDTNRRYKHDAAIANLNILNRICDAYETERICPVDTSDRHEAAKFIGEWCNEMYQNGQNSNQPQAEKTLNTSVIHKRIADLDSRFGTMCPNENSDEFSL